MHAVLGVDLQPRICARGIAHDFVDASRAVTLLGRVVHSQIDGDRHGRVLETQVAGLVLVVIGVRQEDGRESIERELPVRLRVLDRLARGSLPECRVVSRVMQRPWRLATKELLLDPEHECAEIEPALHVGFEVARLVQLPPQPATFEGFRIGA